MAFADQLAKIDTEGVEPMAHIAGLQNVWREDTIKTSVDRDLLLEKAIFQLIPMIQLWCATGLRPLISCRHVLKASIPLQPLRKL